MLSLKCWRPELKKVWLRDNTSPLCAKVISVLWTQMETLVPLETRDLLEFQTFKLLQELCSLKGLLLDD